MKQITTHVLDTTLGKPAEGIKIFLQKAIANDQWENIAEGFTNADGRVPDFMRDDQKIKPGIYRMIFETKAYFEKIDMQAFYPEVHVIFEIRDAAHYHIPLLLSPFGYSTYRGS